MSLHNRTIFLAGATGLAGASIMSCLLENHPSVVIHAACHTTDPFLKHERVHYVSGDLLSPQDCRRMVRGCDCAVMAAAYTGGAGFIRSHPWEHVKRNLSMNLQLLEALQQEGIKRAIYIGSATLYQDFEGSIKEDDLDLNQEPHPAYLGFGWSVRFMEKMCKFFHELYGIEMIVVRAANIFGPYAKFNPETSNFIPAIIRKAADKMDPFEVWGGPEVTRDVIYADDFARAIMLMLDNTDIKFDTFNLGSETTTTVGDVVNWSLKYADHQPSKITYVQDKPTTMRFRALDCSKARNILQWQPRHSIEDGIKKTTAWWIANKEWWKK